MFQAQLVLSLAVVFHLLIVVLLLEMPGTLLTWVHTSYSSTHRCSFFGTSLVTWPVLEFLGLWDESQQEPLGNFEKARFITHMYTLGDRVMSWMKEREFSSVQFTQSSPSLCDPVDSTPGFPVHHQLPELTQTHVIELVMPSNYFILCHPLLLPPSIVPSIRVFSKESVLCVRWPKYWSFSFSVSPSNEYLGLMSFSMDWLDLLAVQGTLKSLLQHHSSKASLLQHSAFLIVQLSHPYMTNGKIIALTRWAFVSKVMSLLFNMLSKFVIAFLPRSKHLLFTDGCSHHL